MGATKFARSYSHSVRAALCLAPAVLLSSGAVPKPALAVDPAFEAVRDAIIHLGLGDASKAQLDRWIDTGFLVDDKCTVMTAKHVIDGVDEARLLGAFQLPTDRKKVKYLAAEVIDDAADSDIAFVRLKDPRPDHPCRFRVLHPLALSDTSDIHDHAGEEILIAGFPRIAPPEAGKPSAVIIRRGIVASTEIAVDNRPMILLDLSSVPGYSGSPIVHFASGKVIGVNFGPGMTERDSDFAWATPVSVDDYHDAIKRIDEGQPSSAGVEEQSVVGVDAEP